MLIGTAFVAGLLVGLRHALEPDHLAAVTTLASQSAPGRHTATLGVAWGVGHTASIGVVAAVLIGFGVHIPERFHATAELGVALLLVILGAGAGRRWWRVHRERHIPDTRHGAIATPPIQPGAIRAPRGALGFGLIHGLAGSGAVIVLAVAASPVRAVQVAYLMAFSVGSILSMATVSTLSGTVLDVAQVHAPRWPRHLQLGTAMASIAAGVLLGTEVIGGW